MVGAAQEQVLQLARSSARSRAKRDQRKLATEFAPNYRISEASTMMKFRVPLLAFPLISLLLSTSVRADAEAEKYVDDALPLMYHTCKSVVDESNGDNAYVDKVVRALVAVSLYNREVDIANFAKSDDDKAKLRDKFISELAEGCEDDKNALLAGVIDEAVAEALSSK
jgi:hypothetical protein